MPPGRRPLAALVLAIAAVLIGAQLLVKPIVGLPDNGDFTRIMGPTGLAYLSDRYDERYWGWALTKFAILGNPAGGQEAISPETLLAMTAVNVNRLLVSQRLFDIRVLGAIHSLLFLGFLALLAFACRDLVAAAWWTTMVLAVFFFTDVGYVATYNSLYKQVASLLFLLLAAGIAAEAIRRGGLDSPALFFYFLCAACFVASKPQEIIQGPVLAVLGYRLARVPGRKFWREPALWMAVLLCGVSGWYYTVIPQRTIRQASLYDSVFVELLGNSTDPAADLEALGLEPALIRFVARNAYAADAPLAQPEFQKAFFDRVGYGALIRFYAVRPGRLIARLEPYGRLAFWLRPRGFGNFDQASGRPYQALSHGFDGWSSARVKLRRHGLAWVVGLIGANFAAALLLSPRTPRGRLFRDGLIALCIMATLEFLVCGLADFRVEAERHLFVFQAMWDLLVIIDLAWVVQAIDLRRHRPAATAVA